MLHGGFGLRTVGDLATPRFWALAMLERLGEREIRVSGQGDGAGSLVEAWAGRDDDGRVAVAVWNGTLDRSKAGGHDSLSRTVRIRFTGLTGDYVVRHHRVDEERSNIAAVWHGISDGSAWPTDAQWAESRAADQLERGDVDQVVHDDAEVVFTLPMPSTSLIELVPP
ncbi:GH39 family glycosyl hydrolase [Kibdelosporangium phytohabitans]|uniref:Glycosyl hydrolases family 39 N-terminal catalytic domain-containing protein n=1 Tax=Kibdelosporangium phytohabitans TaxID=860235 RepID=A0A0N9I083_9PSEU|nr:hypothetical protein [Kibdelosporangium phytohabitans]ALG10993.1 hypothetical protein AOZ06_32560 [Kibdelosporangium phytohabitans]MBE1462206.1 xylan 1,4-beta-xylosidase [Kibdelosporangium phytohabitans]